jgi:hypothetical protein
MEYPDSNEHDDSDSMTGMGLTGPDKMLMEEQQAQAMQNAQNNPFEAPQYQGMQAPDQPVNYGGGMADLLLSDSEVPKVLRHKYWWIFNKDNVLTFLDEKRKDKKMMSFDVSVIDIMNSMDSYDDYTFDSELQYSLMRNALDVKLDRAVGFNGTNMKNERVILQSQFNESRAITEDGNQGQVKEGFFRRLLGRR